MATDTPNDELLAGVAALEFWRDRDLARRVHSAESPDDWERLFFELETVGCFAAAAAECPYFVTTPTILASEDEWGTKRDPSIDEGTWRRLTKRSFMPLDRKLFARRALTDLVDVSETSATHPLVDLDYGLVLTPGARTKNFTLDHAHLMRVQNVDKYYVQYPSAIFSIGAFRARALLNLPSNEPWTVPEFEIRDRAELDAIIGKLRDALVTYPKVELWFRGQSREFLLDAALQSEPLCPWRATRDASLVPSLYRAAWHGKDLRSYADRLVRIQRYVSFARLYLGIQPFNVRSPAEPPTEKLPREWDSYALAFSSHQIDEHGNHVSARDYHIAFDGLQRSFFLQHYGLPSNILDITNDVDIALFFAQNEASKDGFLAQPKDHDSVLYAFVLLPGVDRFLDSTTLSERFGLLRPARQRCGMLCGASFINRNHYARYISVKFRLRDSVSYDRGITPAYVYPPREEDPFLDGLLKFAEGNRNELRDMLPFAPNLG